MHLITLNITTLITTASTWTSPERRAHFTNGFLSTHFSCHYTSFMLNWWKWFFVLFFSSFSHSQTWNKKKTFGKTEIEETKSFQYCFRCVFFFATSFADDEARNETVHFSAVFYFYCCLFFRMRSHFASGENVSKFIPMQSSSSIDAARLLSKFVLEEEIDEWRSATGC